MAIAEAISVPFCRFAHTAYVHVDNSGCSLAQDTQKVGVNKEMKVSEWKGPVLLPFVEEGDTKVFDE